jgi:hypothetical protein
MTTTPIVSHAELVPVAEPLFTALLTLPHKITRTLSMQQSHPGSEPTHLAANAAPITATTSAAPQ